MSAQPLDATMEQAFGTVLYAQRAQVTLNRPE